MLWDYGHYTFSNSYSAGIDFRRKILTSKVDPRAVRVNIPNYDLYYKTHIMLTPYTAQHAYIRFKSVAV